MRKGISITVTPADRVRLEAIVRDRNSPRKHVWRAIVLLTADGTGTNAITRAVGKDKTVVWRWQERFMHEGIEGLPRDKTRPSRITPLPAETVDRVVTLTNQAPPHEATKRHGTTTLFAALSVLDGTVIGRCMQRHRHSEFIRFLNAVERDVPAGKLIHTVLDNYATQKHPKVWAWLSRHPRWTFHFTPISASWLNAVETFFSKMTRQRIRRGVFRSIVDLQTAINAYLAERNASPKPFVWTKSAEAILAKLDRLPVTSL